MSRTKSKMGRPQRKQQSSKSDANMPGRVAVYCVGSAIDLNALRAHVFRRGFGSNQSWNNEDNTPPELTLPRKSGEVDLDDAVLHVSNAPLFYSSSDTLVSSASELSGRDGKLYWSGPSPMLVHVILSYVHCNHNSPSLNILRQKMLDSLTLHKAMKTMIRWRTCLPKRRKC